MNELENGQLDPIPSSAQESEEITQVSSSETVHDGVDAPKKKKKTGKKIIIGILLAVIAYLIYSIAHFFITPNDQIPQTHLVPADAAIIIQVSEPVKDWRKFSQSEPWQTLKRAKSFEEVTENVESLDSIIQNNKMFLSLVGKRDILISLHKVKRDDWDALIIVDLQKASKIDLLKEQIETVLKMSGSDVKSRDYKSSNILEMRDPDTKEILYLTFIANHCVVSYTAKLVESAIEEKENPRIGLKESFIEAESKVAGKGLCRMFINYDYLPEFMGIYLDEKNEYLDMFSKSMEFAGLYFNSDKEKMEVKGYTLQKESADPYVTALLNSGKHKMKAHEILSARTAFYTNIGMDNPVKFVKELETIMATDNEAAYKSYESSRKKIESLFGISLEEHFLSWMSGEFAITQSEPGLLGQEPETILAIRAKNIKDARKGMEFMEKKIKGRTPITIKTVTYKKYDINYIELKGFFRLFFGSLFDKFEKPYYTYIDDYVIFSNKPASILSLIEDYEQKNVMKNDPGFKKAYSNFNNNSTLFIHTSMHRFFPLLKPMVTRETWNDLQPNRDVLYSFPHWSMQVVGDKQSSSLHYIMDHKRYETELISEVEVIDDEDDKELKEDATTEKELMNELKRFYVEKFQGNVLREFYPEGAIKSESEVKNGQRHGRHREYYENGKLRLRGKYANNRPKGTWKYYTEEGKFDKKEKF